MSVDFDTGSADFFLPGPNCTQNCAGHKVYNPSSSSTSTAIRASFSLLYGDGSSVQGITYTDTVTIGGLTATNQTLGVATTYSTGFNSTYYPPDGLMGLAWGRVSIYRAPGYFQTLVSEGQVTSSVFAVKLAVSGSELFLGGVNTALYTGSFTWLPVTKEVSNSYPLSLSYVIPSYESLGLLASNSR
jgi:cathepsin D